MTMSEKILSLCSSDSVQSQSLLIDRVFTRKVVKCHRTMAFMEKSKYLEPHFSFAFDKLAAKIQSENNRSDSAGGLSNTSGLSMFEQEEIKKQKEEYRKRILGIMIPQGVKKTKSRSPNKTVISTHNTSYQKKLNTLFPTVGRQK